MSEESRLYKKLYENALSELRMHASVSADLSVEYNMLAKNCKNPDYTVEHKLTSGVHKRYSERINSSIEKLNKLKEQYER